MRIRFKIDEVLIAFYVSILVVPILSTIIPTICIAILLAILSLYIFSKLYIINKKYLALIISVTFIIAIDIIAKNGTSLTTVYSIYFNIFPVLVGVYLINYGREKFNNFLLKLILLCAFITIISTCYGLLANPMVSRLLATGAEHIYTAVKWGNIGGFEFIYSLDLLLICIVILLRKHKIKFVSFVVLYLAACVCIVLSQYTLALLFIVPSIFLLIVTSTKSRKIRSAVLLLTIIICMRGKQILLKGIDVLRSISKSEIVIERLYYLSNFLQGIETTSDVSIRLEAYEKSLQSFIDNMVNLNFLKNVSEIGGHSTILDCLGTFGLIGVCLLILFYYNYWTGMLKPNCGKDRFPFLFFIYVSIALQIFNTLSLVNYVGIIMVPLIAKYTYKEG